MSSDLERRAKRVLSPLPGRYTWLPLDRGEGSWLITKDGRRVLDLTCGIAVTNVGHAHPKVVKAVSEQAAKLMHISTGVATYVRMHFALRSAPIGVHTPTNGLRQVTRA